MWATALKIPKIFLKIFVVGEDLAGVAATPWAERTCGSGATLEAWLAVVHMTMIVTVGVFGGAGAERPGKRGSRPLRSLRPRKLELTVDLKSATIRLASLAAPGALVVLTPSKSTTYAV